MHKLSYLQGNEWIAHTHGACYALPDESAAIRRLTATVPAGDPVVFERLAASMQAPYLLLYVLHTPRGEGEPGRYQSPELSLDELHAFMARFGPYLSADARFDLWAYSPAEQATIVWDRHDQLFGYGPLDRFAAELRALGFNAGDVNVPAPHMHHYRAEYDALANELLEALPWSYSALRPEDEQ